MEVLELSKNYCKKFYNGSFDKMIEEKDGIIFDNKVIKSAFNSGNGTKKDFKRYMKNNKVFCKYYDLKNKIYIY